MASTAVAVGGQLSLSLSLPRKGTKSIAGRSAHFTAAPCVVSASARLGGRTQQPSSFGAAQEQKERFSSVIVKASEQADPTEQASDLLKSLQETWDKVDDKLAIGGLGFAGLILLWASTGLISAIDKLPLIPDFFEFIGILFSGWFTYRYLLFKPDREELVKIIDEAKGKIAGIGRRRNGSRSKGRINERDSRHSATRGGKMRPTIGDGIGAEQNQPSSTADNNGTGTNKGGTSNIVRRLGRDDDRDSSEWQAEGSVLGEWRGFSDPDLNGNGKPNGTARPDVSV